MTAICNGGTSSPIDPSQLWLNLTSSAIAELLFTGAVGWFAPAASGLGYLTYSLLDLCSRDPPPMPNVDAARFAGYFNPLNPQGAAQLRDDATAIIANILWSQYCKCDNNTLPPPFTPPPKPPGVTVNPPDPNAYPTANPCAYYDWFSSTPIGADGSFSSPPTHGDTTTTTPLWGTFVHNVSVEGTQTGFPITINLEWRENANGPIIDTSTFVETEFRGANNPFKDHVIVPPGAKYVTQSGHASVSTAGNLTENEFLYLFCSAAPPVIDQPCCPPDPTLENLLIQVLQNEQLILSLLGVKPTYKRGLVHAGLTGEGTIAVTNPFGVHIQITQGTPTNPSLPGVPPYQWSVGWISIITPDGMIDEVRITRQSQVWASRLAPFASLVGYHVNPGFTITVTELDPA